MTAPHLLVVDDERIVRIFFEGALQHRQLQSPRGEFSGCSPDAGQPRIEVVVLNLQLPYGDGLSVPRRMKQLSPETFVIVMTAPGRTMSLTRSSWAPTAAFASPSPRTIWRSSSTRSWKPAE